MLMMTAAVVRPRLVMVRDHVDHRRRNHLMKRTIAVVALPTDVPAIVMRIKMLHLQQLCVAVRNRDGRKWRSLKLQAAHHEAKTKRRCTEPGIKSCHCICPPLDVEAFNMKRPI